MQGVDQTLNEQEAAHLLTESKLDLDRLALETGYAVTQAEEDATALSIKGAHERAGKKIIHDKYAAAFAEEYGNYWVRKLIKEEELKLLKKGGDK